MLDLVRQEPGPERRAAAGAVLRPHRPAPQRAAHVPDADAGARAPPRPRPPVLRCGDARQGDAERAAARSRLAGRAAHAARAPDGRDRRASSTRSGDTPRVAGKRRRRNAARAKRRRGNTAPQAARQTRRGCPAYFAGNSSSSLIVTRPGASRRADRRGRRLADPQRDEAVGLSCGRAARSSPWRFLTTQRAAQRDPRRVGDRGRRRSCRWRRRPARSYPGVRVTSLSADELRPT